MSGMFKPVTLKVGISEALTCFSSITIFLYENVCVCHKAYSKEVNVRYAQIAYIRLTPEGYRSLLPV